MAAKYYLYNVRTDQKYPINGFVINDTPVDAIPMEQLVSPQTTELPRAVDLRQFMSKVEAQSTTNSW